MEENIAIPITPLLVTFSFYAGMVYYIIPGYKSGP